MRKIILTIIVGITFILTSCASGYTNISTSELSSNLGKDANYLDVRTSSEYNSNHINGFDNVDYYLFKDNMSLLDTYDKTKPTYVICRSGNRSASASKLLVEYGFTEVYNVTGGMNNW